jgi:hypothetical protein
MVSVVSVPVQGEPTRVTIGEWVVEAGPRLWIVRASEVLEDGGDQINPLGTLPTSVSTLRLASPDVTRPSLSPEAARGTGIPDAGFFDQGHSEPDLPFPGWWDGDCDTNYFLRQTGYSAYPLGTSYRGVKACGPRPSRHPYVQTTWDLDVGYPQLEWQCPELSKRFLYIAYGVEPYAGNGNDVVTGYPGDLLDKVWNCTVGQPPQPGDVLSYGAHSQWGHTSVVVASDVDGSGNGTIEVMEQNSSVDGHNTHAVSGWCVNAYTDVIGWLHFPDWEVTYYADESLTNPCASDAAAEAYLFYDWGAAGPGEGCPSESFSARFSRSVEFPGGEYTFALGYDHGARLKIDGATVIDGWSGSSEHYATVDLPPGGHQLDVELHQGAGDAALSFFWWGPGFELSREVQDTSRWYAEYWPNQTLWWDPVATVQGGEDVLDEQWTSGSPTAGVPVDHFSSRFRRTVSLDAGQWQFDIASDDGVRFWVNDVLVLDEWQDQVALFTPTVSLESGDHELKIEHYENLEWAKVGANWEQVSGNPAPGGWLTAPIDGSVIGACPLSIEAQVDPGLGPVDRVEFYANYHGTWHHLDDDHDAPFTELWDCESIVDRRADLLVHVWDDSGREYVDPSGVVTVELAHREHLHLPLVLKGASSLGF